VTTIETLFFIILFVILFFGAVELGRAIALKHSLDVGVYRAARYLSIDPDDWAGAEAMIRAEVADNVLGGSYSTSVVVTMDMPDSSFGSVFTVRAELPYQALVPLVPLAPRTLASEHAQSIERYP
jgi:Flp pilus assembly protein TadG